MLPLRVLLVDDNPDFLDAVARFLAAENTVTIIGCVRSGRKALEVVAHARPDLVLLDLTMPDMNGLDVTQSLATQPDRPHIVILTMQDTPVYREASIAAGANAFIVKTDFVRQWPRVLASLVEGER